MTVTADQGYQMSAQHKEHLALGRERSRVIRRYLDALHQASPKRGRRVSAETVQTRLDRVVGQITTETNTLRLLQLFAERDRLQRALSVPAGGVEDISDLEAAFVEVAKEYSDRKGISYAAWRELGVPAAVLRAADISRS